MTAPKPPVVAYLAVARENLYCPKHRAYAYEDEVGVELIRDPELAGCDACGYAPSIGTDYDPADEGPSDA